MANELLELGLVAAAEGVAKGDFTASELTEASLGAAGEAQPHLNCFIRIDAEGAMAAAERADEHRARGSALGPLHGVPLAHKDMFYRAGAISTCGSKIRADFRPDVTATVLERLDAAGAVTVGTLNMAEFATGPTGHNEHYGACRNPWNTDHVTGGSSSGSGSATAGRVVFGALGSDTGGSVRLPAAACGLFGMKGTQTRVSRYGCMGLSFSMDNVGPLARTARDCARMMEVIAGPDPRDPTASQYPVGAYERATIDPDIRGMRFGVPNAYFLDELDSQVQRQLDDSLAVFRDLGAEVVEVEIPLADVMGSLGGPISGIEALALHRAWMRDRPQDYGAQTIARHQSNLAVPAADYLAAVQSRPRIIRQFVESVFAQCDVLQVPVFPMPLPTIEASDVRDGQGFERLLATITRNTRPFNFLALPALSVPAGFCDNNLPVGFQLVGRPFAEKRLFRAGAAFEGAAGFAAKRPDCAWLEAAA